MQENFPVGAHDDSAAWMHLGRTLLRACKRLEEAGSTAHCAALPRIPHRR